MKKQVHPAFMSVLLAVVLGVVGYYLFHAATDKPYYPGWNVGPGGGPGMTEQSGKAAMQAMQAMKSAPPKGVPPTKSASGAPSQTPTTGAVKPGEPVKPTEGAKPTEGTKPAEGEIGRAHV